MSFLAPRTTKAAQGEGWRGGELYPPRGVQLLSERQERSARVPLETLAGYWSGFLSVDFHGCSIGPRKRGSRQVSSHLD